MDRVQNLLVTIPVTMPVNNATNAPNQSPATQDIPAFSYNGSHLPPEVFREDVLEPHRIKIHDTAPMQGLLPEPLLAMIEKEIIEASRFNAQKNAFRDQIEVGRGFGSSPLFPPNVLPPIDKEPCLARCMVPNFSRDALPVRAGNQTSPLYELSVPHAGLGCGFSVSAFNDDEITAMPSWLMTTGTIVHFDTGYISPGAPLYCPFLTFELISENQEAANNQCAIGGAWSVRALQMLYALAWKGQMVPEMPVSFSCAIDNTHATLNFHWIEDDFYCMAPLNTFDLGDDDQFASFQVWVQSIGRWALIYHLPLIKTALDRIQIKVTTPPATPRPPKLSIATALCPDEILISSLKTTFGNIPWRFEDDEFTPVSSSTASWGSPLITDKTFQLPAGSSPYGTAPPRSAVAKRAFFQAGQPTPPPAYAQNTELMWQKRFSHAMDEIRELQNQLQTLKSEVDGSTISMKDELTGVKTTISSVLRKETLNQRNRSFSTSETWTMQTVQQSPLVNEVHPTFLIDRASPVKQKPVLPNLAQKQIRAPKSPALLSPGFPSPGFSSTGMPSPGMPSPTFSMYSENNVVVVPPAPPISSLWKFSTIMLTGHMMATFIPSTIARVFVLGLVTDACLLSFASPHYPSSLAYLSSLWRSG